MFWHKDKIHHSILSYFRGKTAAFLMIGDFIASFICFYIILSWATSWFSCHHGRLLGESNSSQLMEFIFIALFWGILIWERAWHPKELGVEGRGSLLFIFLQTHFFLHLSAPMSTLISEVKNLTFPYMQSDTGKRCRGQDVKYRRSLGWRELPLPWEHSMLKIFCGGITGWTGETEN